MEAFIGGLPQSIEGNVTASKPQTLEEATNIAHRLMDQIIKHDSVQETNDHKRKFKDKRNTIEPGVLRRFESVAYKLKLPQELSRVHNMFHISNLRKYYADEPLVVPLDGLHLDNELWFVEKPVEVMNREVKQLKQSRNPIVKVQGNSRRGPELHVNVKTN
ncbi:hypothetical protein Tco_0077834 [Tanacetum coccineum]